MNDFASDTRSDPVVRARELGPAIAAAANEIERTQRIGEPLLSQLHDARLCRMLLPRAADGDEAEPWVYLHAIEEISRHDGSVGWNVFVANSSALIAPFLATEPMRTIFADPRAIVAWGPPNASRATAVPGGYRVTGRWDFASGCRQATWMGSHCHVVESDGTLRLNAAGKPTVRTLLYPVSQATLLNTWNVIGMRGTASDSYTLSDVFVPEAFMLSASRESRWASRGECWMRSWNSPRARRRAILVDLPTMPSCRRALRRWKRDWARRTRIWWRRCPPFGTPRTTLA